MLLGIATVVVLVLLAIALLPVRKAGDLKPTNPLSMIQPEQARPVSLREQHVQEEASAIAAEYHRRADEVWLDEIRSKAALLLGPTDKTVKP